MIIDYFLNLTLRDHRSTHRSQDMKKYHSASHASTALKRLVRPLAFAIALLFSSCSLLAALPPHFQSKPLRIIVAVPAGGSVDNATRAMAQLLSESNKINVIIDNRPGGTGTIAMNLAAQAPADGHTLLSASNSILITGALKKVPYDLMKAFEPVVQMTSSAYVLVVSSSLAVQSLKELIAMAKNQPNQLKFGSPGVGSIIHLSTEILNHKAGSILMTHIPFKGNSYAVIDLISGRLDVLLSAGVSVAQHVQSSKLRALAVTGQTRMNLFKDVPTLSQAGLPGLILDNLYGLYAPSGVSADTLASLNREIQLIMNQPSMRVRLANDGAEPAPPRTSAQFKIFIQEQFNQWQQFIQKAGLHIE